MSESSDLTLEVEAVRKGGKWAFKITGNTALEFDSQLAALKAGSDILTTLAETAGRIESVKVDSGCKSVKVSDAAMDDMLDAVENRP